MPAFIKKDDFGSQVHNGMILADTGHLAEVTDFSEPIKVWVEARGLKADERE